MNYISIVKAVGLTAVISSLTACYVMPVQPHQNSPQYTVAPVVIKPVEKEPVQFPARLYPANAKAAKHGQVVGWVSNNLEGRGKFMMTISGEVFEGEAQRDPMGISLYTRPSDQKIFAIVGRKTGPSGSYLWQYELSGNGKFAAAKVVRKFGAYSGKKEIEAIAVDNELGTVLYCDEQFGIRKYKADPALNDNKELALFE